MAGTSVFQASSRLKPSGAENDTRMKKRPLFTSPNWALSVMLQPSPASRMAMAATMPGLSAQDRVRTKEGLRKDMRFPNRGGAKLSSQKWPSRALRKELSENKKTLGRHSLAGQGMSA